MSAPASGSGKAVNNHWKDLIHDNLSESPEDAVA